VAPAIAPAALPLITAIGSQPSDELESITSWHVHVHIVLPLQQACRLVAHGAKQRTRSNGVAQLSAAHIHIEGSDELVAAL
jgi:hypothetical protein